MAFRPRRDPATNVMAMVELRAYAAERRRIERQAATARWRSDPKL